MTKIELRNTTNEFVFETPSPLHMVSGDISTAYANKNSVLAFYNEGKKEKVMIPWSVLNQCVIVLTETETEN